MAALEPDRNGQTARQRGPTPLHTASPAGAHKSAGRNGLLGLRKAPRHRASGLESAPLDLMRTGTFAV